MALPNIRVYIRPDSSFVVGGTAVLGSTKLGSLVSGGTPFLLGPPAGAFYELSDVATQVSIRRGRTRVTDSFDAGNATVTIVDRNAIFSPDNTSSPLYVSGTSYVKPLRQFRITATVNSVEYDLFNGYTTAYNYQYEPGIAASLVTISAVDAFRLLNLARITTVTGATTGEYSGTRIGRILTQIGVPNGLQSLETGSGALTADPGTDRSALEAIQQIETTELGAFYIDAAGQFIFKSRWTLQQLASGAITTPLVFNETSGIPFTAIEQQFDDEQVYNDVTVGGTASGTSQQTDTTSINTYFTRSLQQTDTLLQTSTEATDYAKFLLNFRKNPTLLIDAIEVMPMALSTANAVSVVSMDLLQPITVTKAYGSSNSLTRTLTVQGIAHDITPNSWRMAMSTAEPVSGDGFILNSSTYGILDTNTLSF